MRLIRPLPQKSRGEHLRGRQLCLVGVEFVVTMDNWTLHHMHAFSSVHVDGYLLHPMLKRPLN